MCNLTFFSGGWQKIVAQIRGVFRKMFIYYSPGGRNLAPKHLFTPIFRLHTVTAGFGDRPFGYFLRPFHVFTEIYPLVPFPPSVREGVSDYTRTSLRWAPSACFTRECAHSAMCTTRRIHPTSRPHPERCFACMHLAGALTAIWASGHRRDVHWTCSTLLLFCYIGRSKKEIRRGAEILMICFGPSQRAAVLASRGV